MTDNFSWDIKVYLKNKGVKQKELAEKLGVSHSVISNVINGRDILGKQAAMRWSDALGIDPLWLMTQGAQGTPPGDSAPANVGTDVINIPIINLDVRGGILPNDIVDAPQYVTDTMPFSRSIASEGDVVVPVYGDSMVPRYPEGSRLLIRPLPMWREWLELGRPYILELGDWRRIIKVVRKGSTADTFTLESYNPRYDASEINKSFIQHVWQVVMCVSREAM